jgi:hypothetical protein
MPNRTARLRVLLAAALLAAAPAAAAGQAARAAAPAPQPAYGARVQIMSPRLGTGWHTGVVGRVGACLAVMIQREGGESPAFTAVRFDEVDRLRMSSRYDGRPDAAGRPAEYRPGLDTTGERWIEVAVQPLRARYGDCTPF